VLGQLAIQRNRGHDFFVEIGRKGQKVMRTRYPNMAREWGKLGDRLKDALLRELVVSNEEVRRSG